MTGIGPPGCQTLCAWSGRKQFGECSYMIVYHSISQYITVYHSISQYTTVYHNISQYTTVYHNISQYTILHYSILQYTTVYHSISLMHQPCANAKGSTVNSEGSS